MKKIITLFLCLSFSLFLSSQTYQINNHKKFTFTFTDSCITIHHNKDLYVFNAKREPNGFYYTGIWISTEAYDGKIFKYSLLPKRRSGHYILVETTKDVFTKKTSIYYLRVHQIKDYAIINNRITVKKGF